MAKKQKISEVEMIAAAKRLRKLNRLANLIKQYQDEMKETLTVAFKERNISEFSTDEVRATFSSYEKEILSSNAVKELFPKIYNQLKKVNTIERITVK